MAVAAPYTLNELLLALGQFYGDAHKIQVTEQAIGPLLFTCADLAYGRPDRYAGSELWPWLPSASGVAGPLTVSASTGVAAVGSRAPGTLTLTKAWQSGAFDVGTVATLQNIGGKGKPHQRKEWAIKMALADDALLHPIQATVAAPDQETYWNDVPATLRSLTKVYVNYANGNRREVGPARWRENLDAQARRLYLPLYFEAGDTVLLEGRADLDWPFTPVAGVVDYNTALDNIDPARIIKEAVMWLSFGGREQRAPEIAANMYNDRLRTARDLPWPDEVWLG